MNNISIIATVYSSSTKQVNRSDNNGVIQMCEASLFVDFQKGGEMQTGWLLAEAWGSVSEQLANIQSGQSVLVSGSVQEFQSNTPGGAINRYPKITVRNVVHLLGGAKQLFSSVHLEGRLVADPEYRSLSDGSLVANCRIAVDNFRDKKSPNFYNLETWAKTAETLISFCYSGKQILIEGSLKFNNYISPTTGEAATNFRIRVNTLKLGLDTQEVRNTKFNNAALGIQTSSPQTVAQDSGARQSPFQSVPTTHPNQNNDSPVESTVQPTTQSVHIEEPSLDDIPF